LKVPSIDWIVPWICSSCVCASDTAGNASAEEASAAPKMRGKYRTKKARIVVSFLTLAVAVKVPLVVCSSLC
jgi:hypothetical protein